jgi:predicted Rossmann fold nucleotide-binding protein DprA/Smf involved in DNA uptake
MSRDPREVVREEQWMTPRILEALADGPLTVPEIATAIGCPADETIVWVMGMRRYGHLRELKGPTDDGYFRYEAAERTSP